MIDWTQTIEECLDNTSIPTKSSYNEVYIQTIYLRDANNLNSRHQVEASFYSLDDAYTILVQALENDVIDDLELIKCEECGDIEYRDDSSYVEDVGDVCSSCINNYYFWCEDNEQYYHNRQGSVDINEIRNNRSQIVRTISQNAYDNGDYFYCEHCSDHFHAHEMSDYEHSVICIMCRDDVDDDDEIEPDDDDSIHSYNYKPRPVFFGDKSKRFYGVELEVEFQNSRNVVANDIIQKSEFYMKEDSSLENGIEFVTHPMNLSNHQNFWESMIKDIKSVDARSKSHDVSTCGLHVHVGLVGLNEAMINRIVIFTLMCKRQIETIARRRNNNYAVFTPFIGMKKTKKALKDNGRYSAINFTSSTLEFRFFKGTLKHETLISSIEFIDAMIEFCKDKHSLSTKCDSNSFWQRFINKTDFTKYNHLETYLISKHLIQTEGALCA